MSYTDTDKAADNLKSEIMNAIQMHDSPYWQFWRTIKSREDLKQLIKDFLEETSKRGFNVSNAWRDSIEYALIADTIDLPESYSPQTINTWHALRWAIQSITNQKYYGRRLFPSMANRNFDVYKKEDLFFLVSLKMMDQIRGISFHKKNCLKEFTPDSPKYVIAHAVMRYKKGKKPSLAPFKTKNPNKVLQEAIKHEELFASIVFCKYGSFGEQEFWDKRYCELTGNKVGALKHFLKNYNDYSWNKLAINKHYCDNYSRKEYPEWTDLPTVSILRCIMNEGIRNKR